MMKEEGDNKETPLLGQPEDIEKGEDTQKEFNRSLGVDHAGIICCGLLMYFLMALGIFTVVKAAGDFFYTPDPCGADVFDKVFSTGTLLNLSVEMSKPAGVRFNHLITETTEQCEYIMKCVSFLSQVSSCQSKEQMHRLVSSPQWDMIDYQETSMYEIYD